TIPASSEPFAEDPPIRRSSMNERMSLAQRTGVTFSTRATPKARYRLEPPASTLSRPDLH
ncbi:MAG: hypothetical protein WBQ22_23200, partial [Bradyrhizobium sp.]